MDRFKDWKQPVFDKDGWTKYGWRCRHPENLKLGNCVDIGCFTYLNAQYGIEIGDNVQIGSHCGVYSVNTENNTKGKIVISDNALIGSHSLILPGVYIPGGAKVKAYSIVKSDKKFTDLNKCEKCEKCAKCKKCGNPIYGVPVGLADLCYECNLKQKG